jgi:adenylylsulfate kinase
LRRNGWCVWITGLPGSGKSIVSEALLNLLSQEGVHAQLLSSDALRKAVTPKPSYSLEERDMVYSTLAYTAKLLTDNSVNVVIDATGNLRRYRENARRQIPRFMEAYLKCPLEVCMEREGKRGKTYQAPRHIYARAVKGEASTVPGIGEPYEPPLRPEIIMDAAKLTPDQCAQRIMQKILFEFGRKKNSAGHWRD